MKSLHMTIVLFPKRTVITVRVFMGQTISGHFRGKMIIAKALIRKQMFGYDVLGYDRSEEGLVVIDIQIYIAAV